MSLKWPAKDPDELLDYSVDWSRYLDGDTLNTVTWYILEDGAKTEWSTGVTIDGLQQVSATNTDTVATIYLGLGTPNKAYRIVCHVTTLGGLITERTIRIKIRDNY